MKVKTITREYLRSHPHNIFVFGDNTERRGYGGAAALRNEPNTYGFITKHTCSVSYTPEQYAPIFEREMVYLTAHIVCVPSNFKFLISPLGAGLANEYGIWEAVIREPLRTRLSDYNNVEFLWED